MGINTHYYTVYGVKHEGYDNEFSETLYDEKYDEIEAHEDVDVIMDGMSGSYMIVGKILFDSGDLRWNDIEDTFVEINPAHLKMYKVKATNAFNTLFPEYKHMAEGEWKLMTLAHYS